MIGCSILPRRSRRSCLCNRGGSCLLIAPVVGEHLRRGFLLCPYLERAMPLMFNIILREAGMMPFAGNIGYDVLPIFSPGCHQTPSGAPGSPPVSDVQCVV